MTKYKLAVMLLAVMMFSSRTAAAEVNLNINIGAPPPVVVASPPAMLFLGEPGVYVAVGVEYDIFFIGGRYFYFHGGNWFWAPGYGGPWVYVQLHALPPGLRKYKIQRLHEFREREYKAYQSQGPRYKGRTFVGHPGNGPNVKDRPNHPERKEGHGKGKGRD